MHCPKCGQQQVSDETRFCSRCGFLLTGVMSVIENDGQLPIAKSRPAGVSSPRKRGIKQGLFVFLLAFLVVPIIAIFTVAVNAEPFAVVISAILLTIGGLLRIAYALMFESGDPAHNTLEENAIAAAQRMFGNTAKQRSLPSQHSIPASDYMAPKAGNWRDTNELQKQPHSVTERTTKLLQDEDDQ